MKQGTNKAYRLFLTVVFLALMLESSGTLADPVARLGLDFHADLTQAIHIHIIVSIFEILVIVACILWLFRGARAKREAPFQRGTLFTLILVFAGMLLFGVLYGQMRGGATLTEALWEVRGFLMMITAYLLIGMFVQTEREANQFTWVLLIAPGLLAAEDIIRAITLSKSVAGNDVAYDHVDSVVVGCAMLLCIAIITYGGTRWQKRYAYAALPVMIVCLLVMKRRAAFPVVGIGVIVLVIFLLRLRPRLFWKYVPPLAIILAIYLAAFWNNQGTLGQPARAISSQFTPDPRDLASNLYRNIERADILANIRQAPITGLGYGQPFVFYYQLPNLSWWPFWHFETHNAVLWVWMKNGAVGFLAFFWLLGRGVYDGSKAVETQREEWALVAELRKRFSRRRSEYMDGSVANTGMHHIMYRTTGAPTQHSGRKKRGHVPGLGLNVPAWERSDDKKSVTAQRSAALALLVVAVCMIPMQVIYSYVDLGLTSERDMLLFGLMLGVIARGHTLLGVQLTERQRGKEPRQMVGATSTTISPVEGKTKELVRAGIGEPGHESVHESVHESAHVSSSSRPRRTAPGLARKAKAPRAQPVASRAAGRQTSRALMRLESDNDAMAYDHEPLPWEVRDGTPS